MTPFIKSLVDSANSDAAAFRNFTLPPDFDTGDYDMCEATLHNPIWLDKFNKIMVTGNATVDNKKVVTARGNNKKKFRKFLARNLACGITGVDLVEKFENLCHRVDSGELRATENFEYYEALLDCDNAMRIMENKATRVSGENNPGYGHGGALSVYSKNFKKYEGLSDEERNERIELVQEKKKQTVADHPERNPLRVEYYEAQGYTPEEAKQMLSERQSTFDIGKCVAKFGEDEGLRVWQARQDGWQDTLKSKTFDERYRIARAKASSVHVTSMNEGSTNATSWVYIMTLSDDMTKIGYTNDVIARIKQIQRDSGKIVKICLTHETRLEHAFEIEDKLVTSLRRHSAFGKGIRVNDFLSTEYFITSDKFDEELEQVVEEMGLNFNEHVTPNNLTTLSSQCNLSPTKFKLNSK